MKNSRTFGILKANAPLCNILKLIWKKFPKSNTLMVNLFVLKRSEKNHFYLFRPLFVLESNKVREFTFARREEPTDTKQNIVREV